MLVLVPSIVVYNNGLSGEMERQRSLKSRLSKQDEFEEVEEDPSSVVEPAVVVEDVEEFTAIVETNTEEMNTPNNIANCIEENEDDNDNQFSSKDLYYDESSNTTEETLDKLSGMLQSSSISTTKLSPVKQSPSKGKEKNEIAVPHSRHRSKTTGKHHRFGKQGSSQSTGSLDESSPALSRESSLEIYTDSSGTDPYQFLLNKVNGKDRVAILKLEQELTNFVKDPKRQHMKFPSMTTRYQRMLVHKVAAFFGLEHNLDQTNSYVIVNKTINTRIPDLRFRDQLGELIPEEPKKLILKRDSSSFEDGKDLKSPERQLSCDSRRSKSIEEREEEYGKVRARIFNQDSSSSQEGAVDSPLRYYEDTIRSSQEDIRWTYEPRPWSSTDSECSNRPSKLLITKTSASTESEPSSSGTSGRALSKESSTEAMSVNSDMLLPRKHIPKASSFGGISVLARDDSISSTNSSSPRLTKAESFNAPTTAYVPPMTRVIETNEYDSSLKKPEAQAPCMKATVSTSTTSVSVASSATSPIAIATPNFPLSTTNVSSRYQILPTQSPGQQGQQVMYAVSNMDSVPAGSVIINPQTGQPYYNLDGTLYRHNPVTIMQPYVSNNNSQLQYQLQTLQQQQQIVSSSQGASPAQAPIIVCAPTQQSAVGEHRPFLSDNGGISPSVVDFYPRLSSSSLCGTFPTSETQLISGGDGGVHLQPPAPTVNLLSSPNAYNVPVNTIPRPNSLSINQMQQPFTNQQVVLMTPQQALHYFSPVSYVGNVPQVASQNGQLTQTMESQQLQQSHLNDITSVPLINTLTPTVPAQSFQGAHCVQNLTASVAPISNYMPPYLSTAPQSQQHSANNTNASVPYPMYSAYTVSPVMNSNTTNNNVVPAINPSQPTTYLTGTGPLYTGNGLSLTNPGGLPLMAPSVIPPTYFQPSQPPPSFKPQTPPTHVPRMVAAGQQNLAVVSNRSFSVNSSGLSTPPCSNYALYTPPVPSTPPQSQSFNIQQNSMTVQPQTQQQISSFPTVSQTQLQYSFPPVLTNMQLFRPGMQIAVRPNTPPSANIIPPTSGNINSSANVNAANPYLNPKSYNIPMVDQRLVKASDVYLMDSTGNNSHLKGLQTAFMPQSLVTSNNIGARPNCNRGMSIFQGDIRLIGPPLQQHMQAPVRVPMMFSQQRPLTRMQSIQHFITNNINRPPRVRRQSRNRSGSNKPDSLNVSTSADQGS